MAGPALGAELASGTPSFRPPRGWRGSPSARAGQLELRCEGAVRGPVAETDGGECCGIARRGLTHNGFAASRRGGAQPVQGGRARKPGSPSGARPAGASVSPLEPGLIAREPNLLCLSSYVSKSEQIPKGSVAEVRVWSMNDRGARWLWGKRRWKRRVVLRAGAIGKRRCASSFWIARRNVAAEKGCFWARKGEHG